MCVAFIRPPLACLTKTFDYVYCIMYIYYTVPIYYIHHRDEGLKKLKT